MISKDNPITAHEVVLMPPTPQQPELFGWIRLINGATDAGYVYLRSTPLLPRLNLSGDYIVTSILPEHAELLLSVLRGQPGLEISFFDPQSDGTEPSVLIRPGNGGGIGDLGNTPDEIAARLTR